VAREAALTSGVSAGFARYWYPLVALVRRDLRQRYAKTTFGLGWTLLQPLVLIAVYVFVFGYILSGSRPTESPTTFVFFMLSGMLPYLAMTDGIQRGSTSLREDKTLFDREAFPEEVVPAVRVFSSAVAELTGLAVFLVLGSALFGLAISPWVLTLPFLMFLRIVVGCGIAWIVSVMTLFITDLGEVLSLLLTAWLFLTPIFYAPETVPAGMQWLLWLNPLHHIVVAYRAVLLDGRPPVPELLFLAGWAMAIAGTGLWFFRKTVDRAKDFL
jgi:lipopolysaccharide transport system permease protein